MGKFKGHSMENIREIFIKFKALSTTFKRDQYAESYKQKEVYFEGKIQDVTDSYVSIVFWPLLDPNKIFELQKTFHVNYCNSPFESTIRKFNCGEFIKGTGILFSLGSLTSLRITNLD